VADATDAARAAADIVLLSPGLGVIIDAIIGSRKIFQRMRNYAIYSVTVTIRMTLTFFILTVAFDWYFPTILIVIIAILNDGTILTISKDRVNPSKSPDNWRLSELFFVAWVYAIYLVTSTIILYVIETQTNFFQHQLHLKTLDAEERRGMIYLQVSVSGQAAIFVARSVQDMSWTQRPGILLALAFMFAQLAATLIGVYGFNGYPNDISGVRGCGWAYALMVWLYCIIWYIPMDFIKKFAFIVFWGKWNFGFSFVDENWIQNLYHHPAPNKKEHTKKSVL